MVEQGWDQLYAEVQSGITGIETGNYRIRVDAVRVRAQSRLLFLDLVVESGVLAGKMTQVNLYLPKPGDRNSGFHFRNKIGGFGDLSATFAAMKAADPDGSNVEAALTILATALLNKVVDAEIELRGEDAGKYEGTNELSKTKPIEGFVNATPAAVAAPVVAAAEAAPAAPPVVPAPAPAAVDQSPGF